MSTLNVFQEAVKVELAKSNASKWGVEESLNVIKAVLIDETGAPEMFDKNEKGEPSELEQAIKLVINPSQFAQSLEAEKMLVRTGRKERVKSALLKFGGK